MNMGLKSRIHRKSHRNKPLSKREMQGNKARSKVRARVEHVFGAQSNDTGGTLVRSIGLARAKAKIGLKNLTYNMRHLVQLERIAMARLPMSFAGGVCLELGFRGKLPCKSMINPEILVKGLHGEPKLAYFVSVAHF